MASNGSLWGVITIIGPLILIAVIAWAALRNRATRRSKDATEQGTRDLYRAEDRAHRGEDDDVP